jgi:Flp pilus assembly protein TadB
MPQEAEYQSSLTDGLREGARELRKEVSRDKIEGRLDDTVSEKPLVKHLLDFRNVLLALAIAAVFTLVVSLASSAKVGAVVLVITFFAAWLILAARSYNARRPTKPIDTDTDDE